MKPPRKTDNLVVLEHRDPPRSAPGANSLRIAEIFYSLQGEGSLVGTPSLFIRLSGCNLRCVWCDTPYASWNPEGDEWPLVGILSEARRSWPNHHVVITGGEPMISPGIVTLTEKLKHDDFHITIETAGTVYEPVACDLMSISPKLANSTPHKREKGKWAAQHDRLRYQPDVLKKLITSYDYQLKFVVSEPGDLEEVAEIVKDIDADRAKVILMPEGVKPSAIAKRMPWIAEACKNNFYRLSPRLHIDLWGDKRGV